MHINFCAILFNRTHDLHFPQNSGKIVIAAPPSKLFPQKVYQCHLLKEVYCMQNFVRFHAIEFKIELSQKLWEKRNNSAPYWAICTHIVSLLFLIIHILCINFCEISSSRNRDERIPKISEKVKLQHHLLSNFHQKLTDVNLCLDNPKYKISWRSVD